MANQNYSADEIKKFEAKDRRIGLQGLVQVLLATGANVQDVAANCALAKQYQDEIYRIAESEIEVKPVQKSIKKPEAKTELPTPTLEQKKILEAISIRTKLTVENLKSPVLKWVKEVTGKEGYPSKVQSVEKFIEWFNKNQQ